MGVIHSWAQVLTQGALIMIALVSTNLNTMVSSISFTETHWLAGKTTKLWESNQTSISLGGWLTKMELVKWWKWIERTKMTWRIFWCKRKECTNNPFKMQCLTLLKALQTYTLWLQMMKSLVIKGSWGTIPPRNLFMIWFPK